MDILNAITESLKEGQISEVKELVQKGLDESLSCQAILNEGLFKGMEVVGELFKEEEMYIPEVLMAAKAMQAGVDMLEPLLVNTKRETKGKIVLGTVKGDLHNLGRNLVGIMLKGAGFEVIDLGEDVSEEKFVEAVRNEGAQIVGMSALITTTMPYMKTTIEALKEAGFMGQVKTIIGGSCVTQRYADEIGADSFAENAGAAVGKAKELLGLK
ncbi:B12-binding domain-containing protein [Chloroflexota bacterium]